MRSGVGQTRSGLWRSEAMHGRRGAALALGDGDVRRSASLPPSGWFRRGLRMGLGRVLLAASRDSIPAMILARRGIVGLLSALMASGLVACGESGSVEPTWAILSAFPAEAAAVLRHATIDETVLRDGFEFRVGHVGEKRVVIAMTGIGLVNAAAATRTLLAGFDVAGVIVAGVAGSFHRIGDVAVPATWTLTGEGSTFAAHAPWLELAERLAQPGGVVLDRCTIVPDTIAIAGAPVGETICLGFEPAVVVGGAGESSDPFGGQAFVCQPGSNDVFGCDIAAADASYPSSGVAGVASQVKAVPAGNISATGPWPASVDQETAAIAREAAAAGVPFIAFRAVSDGEEDPLGLPGFPAQFFVYYRLAAINAAAAAVAFVQQLP